MVTESTLLISFSKDYTDVQVRSELLNLVDSQVDIGFSFATDLFPELDLSLTGETFFRNQETYKNLYQIHSLNTLSHLWLLNLQINSMNVLVHIEKELDI